MENKPDGVYSPFFIGCKSLDTVRRGRTPGDLLLPLAVGTAHRRAGELASLCKRLIPEM
mgnify:CR=1 FL=1